MQSLLNGSKCYQHTHTNEVVFFFFKLRFFDSAVLSVLSVTSGPSLSLLLCCQRSSQLQVKGYVFSHSPPLGHRVTKCVPALTEPKKIKMTFRVFFFLVCNLQRKGRKNRSDKMLVNYRSDKLFFFLKMSHPINLAGKP